VNPWPWRALLYVPAHEERFVARAHERGADAVILDLEDGVPPAAKDEARAALATAVPRVGRGGATVFVRLDHPWRRAWRDAEAAVAAGAEGLLLPKVRDAGSVRAISALLDELEADQGRPVGRTILLPLLEDAAGLLAAREVAACPRVAALIPGNEDLAHAFGVPPGSELFAATHAQLIVAARAEGKAAVGTLGGATDIHDLEAFRAVVARSRRFGFDGVTCIHPAQVPVVHAVFQPDAAEVERAQRIVAAFAAAGGGAVAVDGAMVDRPVAERARALLARVRGGGDA
jgi:citrate lyase subunit beta / citryl-CoA lyase